MAQVAGGDGVNGPQGLGVTISGLVSFVRNKIEAATVISRILGFGACNIIGRVILLTGALLEWWPANYCPRRLAVDPSPPPMIAGRVHPNIPCPQHIP